ncbi:hypothetical protein [Kitasatospora griseola]|uniref:hypothetical protein n=1 Tax=Kitasatospora griseola TaxID=2064 RepID=UPI001910E417|nr:hypothetical protein [Kitasatospora griseola]
MSLQVPPGTGATAAAEALEAHPKAAAPWGARVEAERESTGAPFRAVAGGPAYAALDRAMRDAYGRPVSFLGQGGSIPLCNVLGSTFPDAEMMLTRCPIHAPNECVDPAEIAWIPLAAALLLRTYAQPPALEPATARPRLPPPGWGANCGVTGRGSACAVPARAELSDSARPRRPPGPGPVGPRPSHRARLPWESADRRRTTTGAAREEP